MCYTILIFGFCTFTAIGAEDVYETFPVGRIKLDLRYRPENRFDNNDRNTSAEYPFWKQAEHWFLEWPGNVTEVQPNHALVSWKWRRGKFEQSPCQSELGMEIAVYAYEYLHYTWGPNRLTKAYCEPLAVPRNILGYSYSSRIKDLVAVDFAFVDDTLLVIVEPGIIVRVEGIQMVSRGPRKTKERLEFSVSTGITETVSALVNRKDCCGLKDKFCPYGQLVIAFSNNNRQFPCPIFVSDDGAKTFREIVPETSRYSARLVAILPYPETREVLLAMVHERSIVTVKMSIQNESSVLELSKTGIAVKGHVQAQLVDMGFSGILWDECRVWYLQKYKAPQPALFYVAASACVDSDVRDRNCSVSHLVKSTACHFGRRSSFAAGENGKFSLLAKDNRVFYGVEPRHGLFRLIAVNVDISAIEATKRRSVYAGFDFNNRPKLFYPPKYLKIPFEQIKIRNFEKRLAMRTVGKTLFPSDFMNSFYTENAVLKPNQTQLAIGACQTSTLTINASVTQIPLYYNFECGKTLNVHLTFYSRSNGTKQLKFLQTSLKTIKVSLILTELTSISEEKFWFKYKVQLACATQFNGADPPNLETLTFFTLPSLRCLSQPVVKVYLNLSWPENSETTCSKSDGPGIRPVNKGCETTLPLPVLPNILLQSQSLSKSYSR